MLRTLVALILILVAQGGAVALDYPPVVPGHAFAFPEDHGSHPAYRTEWWYITGWLDTAMHQPLGFQITFFRSRPDLRADNPSSFAPTQLIMGHAALSDPALPHLLHDQRAARAGFGIAEAASADTSVKLDTWALTRSAADAAFHADIPARDFTLKLTLTPTQAPLLQGENTATPGFSQKGPLAVYASNYYSLPHLAVSGNVLRGGKTVPVTGTAWMDHEWSSSLLAPGAVGWDWIGLNLDQGAALMAFRIRNAAGATVWAGGSLRAGDGKVERLKPDAIRFEVTRTWRSPRSGTAYPVAQRVSINTAAGLQQWLLEALMDDQELDSRATTAAIYWEGAVRATPQTPGSPAGRGYLELTGYDHALRF